MKKNEILSTALSYLKQGFSVIPVGRNKKPLLNWKEFQERRATEEEARSWFKKWPRANIAIITGEISGLAVIDIEKGGNVSNLPSARAVRTGGGGFHFYYKWEKGIESRTRVVDLTDIRGTGGFVVAPPSIHASGKKYAWVDETVEIGEFPKELIEKFQKNAKEQSGLKEMIETGVSEGKRNNSAARVFGKLLGALPRDLWGVAWEFGKFWNQKNSPPLPEGELRAVLESIQKKQEQNETGVGEWKFAPILVSELMAKKFEQKKWLVDKLIPEESLVAVSGFSGSYKTWLMLDLAIKVAKGEILFDKFETSQGGVLLIDEESGERLLQERLNLLNGAEDLPIFISSYSSFRLNQKTVDDLVSFCLEKKIRLVIFDSLIRIHGADENDAGKMAEVFRDMKQLSKAGIAVIFIHHNRKSLGIKENPSQAMRGSSDILAVVNCHLAISVKENIIEVRQTKLRDAEAVNPFKLGIVKEKDEEEKERIKFEYNEEIEESKSKVEEAKEIIDVVLRANEKLLNTKELIEAVQGQISVGDSNVKKAIKEMVEAGVLAFRKGEKNATYYLLKDDTEKWVKNIIPNEE